MGKFEDISGREFGFLKVIQYDLTGEFGVGWTTNNNKEFYFDLEDYDRIKNYCWLEHDGYIVSSSGELMHRFILFADENDMETVDHQNHNKRDNRKNNLREASYGENNCNRGLMKNNELKLRGIHRFKNGSYRATIVKDGVSYTKTSKDLDFIIQWRREKENELFGVFAYQGGD